MHIGSGPCVAASSAHPHPTSLGPPSLHSSPDGAGQAGPGLGCGEGGEDVGRGWACAPEAATHGAPPTRAPPPRPLHPTSLPPSPKPLPRLMTGAPAPRPGAHLARRPNSSPTLRANAWGTKPSRRIELARRLRLKLSAGAIDVVRRLLYCITDTTYYRLSTYIHIYGYTSNIVSRIRQYILARSVPHEV